MPSGMPVYIAGDRLELGALGPGEQRGHRRPGDGLGLRDLPQDRDEPGLSVKLPSMK